MSDNTSNNADKGGTLFVYVTYITAIRKVKSDCERLLQILDSRNIKYTKVDVGVLPQRREEMVQLSGKKDIPQVFVDKDYVGGVDEIENWLENDVLENELWEFGYGDEPPPKKDEQPSVAEN